jgi:hypothetical protein
MILVLWAVWKVDRWIMDDIHLPQNINSSKNPYPSYEIKSVGPENMARKTNKSDSTENAMPCIKFSFKIDILMHQTPSYNPFTTIYGWLF